MGKLENVQETQNSLPWLLEEDITNSERHV